MGMFDGLLSSLGFETREEQNARAQKEYDDMAAANAADASAAQQKAEEEANQRMINESIQGMGTQADSQAIQGNAAPEPSFLEKAYQSAVGGLGSLGTSILGDSSGGGGIKGLIHTGGQMIGSPTGMAVLGGLAPVAAGIIGNNAASGNRAASDAAAQAALKAAGTAAQVGPSSLASYTNDPAALAARQQALAGMQQRAQSGLTPEDLIAMRQAQQASDANMQAQQSKINTDMSRRGLNLSPAQAMVQQQQASQALSAQQAAEADRITQQSRAAQLAALQQVGTMGQSAMTNDFSQAQAKASDTNAINSFNAGVLNNAGARTAAAQQTEAQRQLAAGQAKAGNITSIGTGLGGLVGTVANAAKPASANPSDSSLTPEQLKAKYGHA